MSAQLQFRIFFNGRTNFQSGIGIKNYAIWNYTESFERLLFEIILDGEFVISIDKAKIDIAMGKD